MKVRCSFLYRFSRFILYILHSVCWVNGVWYPLNKMIKALKIMKRSDMTPINGLEDIFKIWATHNSVATEFVPRAQIAQKEEALRDQVGLALNILFGAFFVSLVVVYVSHFFSTYQSCVACALLVVGILDCASILWFVTTLFKFHFRDKRSPEMVLFESHWERFKDLFKIHALENYPHRGALWLHVEASLEEACRIHGLKDQSVFINMHEIALRFDMCDANRFSYEPLVRRAKG